MMPVEEAGKTLSEVAAELNTHERECSLRYDAILQRLMMDRIDSIDWIDGSWVCMPRSSAWPRCEYLLRSEDRNVPIPSNSHASCRW